METFSWNKTTWAASTWFRGGNNVESGWLEPVFKIGVKLAASGYQVPWLGMLGDLWTLLGNDDYHTCQNNLHPDLARHPALLDYQDMVFARWSQDSGFCRVRRTISGRTIDRKIDAILFILESWTELGICTGLSVSSGLMVSLAVDCYRLKENGREIIEKEGWPHDLISFVKLVTKNIRNLPRLVDLGIAGIIEKGLDVADRAPRIQLRQITSAQADLDQVVGKTVSSQGIIRHVSSKDVTNGSIPLGGYSSLSVRGRLESLMPSQIAWLDIPIGEINYFQIKYRRQELLYYSRSENLLFKIKRNIYFLIDKSLKGSRKKYPELPFQSLTMLMAVFGCLWEQLKDRVSSEGLTLSLIFVGCGQEFFGEKKLLQLLFSSEIQIGRMQIEDINAELILDWMSRILREGNSSQVVQFVGENPMHQYNGDARNVPCIMLKGSRLVFLDGCTSEQTVTSVWPESWAETIARIIEGVAVP